MKYYTGIDVSLSTSFISIIDEKGKIIKEGIVSTLSDDIANFLKKTGFVSEKIGIESGQLSISLCKSLVAKGLNVICVDARHMAAALSARLNKNDKNDARGIAKMMQANLYKEVLVKSDEACSIKVLLGSRRQLVNTRKQIVGTLRGLLKIYGIKLPNSANNDFYYKIRESIEALDRVNKSSIEALMISLEAQDRSLSELDNLVIEVSKKDEDCRLLTTVPGVGNVTALTYKTSLDDYSRFTNSEAVGAYMGLTPKQYSSGEVNHNGSISKMGPKDGRTMLYEAAQCLLVVSQKKHKLKFWGLRLAKKKGMRKAIVAVARKLAVIMHRMLVTRTEFQY